MENSLNIFLIIFLSIISYSLLQSQTSTTVSVGFFHLRQMQWPIRRNLPSTVARFILGRPIVARLDYRNDINAFQTQLLIDRPQSVLSPMRIAKLIFVTSRFSLHFSSPGQSWLVTVTCLKKVKFKRCVSVSNVLHVRALEYKSEVCILENLNDRRSALRSYKRFRARQRSFLSVTRSRSRLIGWYKAHPTANIVVRLHHQHKPLISLNKTEIVFNWIKLNYSI